MSGLAAKVEHAEQTAPPASQGLVAYRVAIEGFVERQLRAYIPRVQSLPSLRKRAGKEINDAVWRTIALAPFETLILDSPLMQRLRRVRQLGVVHWVYPSAGHTRLEHSIGAVHQVQRLIDSLNRAVGADADRLDTDWVNLLRLAALVHDIGHGLMSHVVENAYDTCGITEQLRLELADEFGGEGCSLSEAAAHYIVRSETFADLVAAARDRTGHALPEDWAQKVGDAILGRTIHDRWPLLQEVISGPFDADKLDYMSRDAQMAGIPNLTDIPRLIQKVRVAEVAAQELPKEIGRAIDNKHASYFVQGVLLSGGRTLDELMIARTLLFDKIYRHQKTRAVEAMFSNAIAALLPALDPDAVLMLPLAIGDDDFVSLTQETIPSRLPIRPGFGSHPGVKIAAELVARIRDRNLFVRAYAFSHTMPHDPFRDDTHQKAGLEALRRTLHSPNPADRAELLAAVADTTDRIARAAGHLVPVELDDLPARHLIALDPFGKPMKTNEIARAYLVTSDGKLVRFREDSAESPAWSNAYVMTRDLGYVFAAGELAPAVYLACETVFRQRFGIRTPPTAIDYAKVDRATVEAIRVKLAADNFYDDKPADLRPVPSRLRKVDVPGVLKTVADKLRPFQPYSASGGDAGGVDEARIFAWLRQFKSEEEVDSALRMLQQLRVLTRGEARSAIEQFLKDNPAFRGCYLCPLGGPRDSSAIITYFAQDLADGWQLQVATLQEALTAEEVRPILFVDDFLGTGRQATTIVKHWIGAPYDGKLDESHGAKLSPLLAEQLKQREVGFAFVYGTTPGQAHLKEELTSAGMKVTVRIHQDESTLPRAFGAGTVEYASAEAETRFKGRCEEIGRKLLSHLHGERWGPGKVLERALGYGNDAYLVVFPYNVPTATLTMLWSEGEVDGASWLPLLPRRKKT